MRQLIAIILTVAILAFFGAVLRKLWVEQGQIWTIPFIAAAILAFGYVMSDPHEREDFKALALWLPRRLGLARPPKKSAAAAQPPASSAPPDFGS